MNPVTANELLDLRAGVGQVASTFRWELVDRGRNVIGQLHPEIGAHLSNTTNGTVFRTVRDLQIRESESRAIDIFRDFVRPSMVLEDGTMWPMGMFAFTSDAYTETTLETPLATSLLDLRFVLNQTMPHSFGVPDGGSVYDAMVEIVGIYGFADAIISPTDTIVGGGPANWPPDATGLTILDSLAQRAGFFPPYFDNDGLLTLRPVDPLQTGIGHRYDRGAGRIERNTLTRSSNLLDAPNAFKVLSSGPTPGEIYAIAYVAPELPHSRERRGFIVTKVIRKQGLPHEEACLEVAQAFARQDASQYATVQYSSVVDPRHDTFDIVEIDGEVYRETGHQPDLESGGTHTHTLVKAVLDGDQ